MENLRKLRSIYYSIEKIITVIIPGIVIAILCIIITCEILSRLLFNYSFMGIVDIAEQAVILVAFLSLAGIQTTKGHITIDFFSVQLKGRRSEHILDCILLAGSILVVAFLVFEMGIYCFNIYQMNMRTLFLFLPILPFAIGVVAGIFFLLISLLFQFKESFDHFMSFK